MKISPALLVFPLIVAAATESVTAKSPIEKFDAGKGDPVFEDLLQPAARRRALKPGEGKAASEAAPQNQVSAAPPEDVVEDLEYHTVRCSWGSSATTGSLFDYCGNRFCEGESSTNAIGKFLFNEAVSANVPEIHVRELVMSRIINAGAQCIFINRLATTEAQHDSALCHCQYLSFLEYCKYVHREPSVKMTFQGDSTVNRLSREITKQCDNTNYDKKNATTSIVFFNEMTLHYLYLPYARETDIKMKNGPANFLVHNLTSVKDFLNTLESAVEEVIASQKSREVPPTFPQPGRFT